MTTPAAPEVDTQAIRAKFEDAKRCSWGPYNVYKYLDLGTDLCDALEQSRAEIERLRAVEQQRDDFIEGFKNQEAQLREQAAEIGRLGRIAEAAKVQMTREPTIPLLVDAVEAWMNPANAETSKFWEREATKNRKAR